jgi:hypothetical protein
MTASQFALAIRADPKWVQNAARILGKRFRYGKAEARWLGLVRQLQRQFGIPLHMAGDMASAALAAPATERAVSVGKSEDGSARVVIDVARYHSSFAASLSAALTLGTPRRRGRRMHRPHHDPVLAARAHGVDIGLIEASLARTPSERVARLDDDAAFLAALRQGRTNRDSSAPHSAVRSRA